MSFDAKLQRLFEAARCEQAPPLDVVGRVLRALPASPATPLVSELPNEDLAEWIGAGVSSLVAAACLWMAASWWSQAWMTSWEAWHPMVTLLQ